jgi:hypothetical protein
VPLNRPVFCAWVVAGVLSFGVAGGRLVHPADVKISDTTTSDMDILKAFTANQSLLGARFPHACCSGKELDRILGDPDIVRFA